MLNKVPKQKKLSTNKIQEIYNSKEREKNIIKKNVVEKHIFLQV